MTIQTSAPRDRFPLFLGVACAALAVLTLALSWQNHSLKAKLASAAEAAIPPGTLKAGDTLAAFDVVDAAGKQTRIAFEGHGDTLLLVFSSTCGACRQTIPTWNRLIAEGVKSSVQVVGLQTDFKGADGAELAIPDLRFPVFGAVDRAAEPLSKFPAIPGAALIDAKGVVKAAWVGVPTDAQVSELRRALAS